MKLTSAERIALEERLETLKRQAIDELRAATPLMEEDAPSVVQEVHTHADDAETGREQEVRSAGIEIDRHRLHEIEEAQRRLACGRFGLCVDCGEEIGRLRLLAQPFAIRCTACQAVLEAHHR
jgi:RNA polymerase-binding transcription factor DksA